MKGRLCVFVAIAGLFIWFFGPALTGANSFAFRDAAHFYYPLFEFVRDEWAAGRIPLWNPYENAGVPLLASGTASVFYPGKLLFVLPLSYTLLYNAYVVLHVLLAAGTAFRLARAWGCSVEAAGLCGLSYAFGGSVLTQHANVVYLVGAAWLPLALLAGDRLLATRRIGYALALGAVLAMMVLAGDPQLAYHAGLAIAGYAALQWWDERTARRAPAANPGREQLSRWRKLLLSRPAGLAIAALAAATLAAVQILPTAEFVRLSGRTAYTLPRSVYGLPGYWMGTANRQPGWYTGLLGHAEMDAPATLAAYDFSLSPWRVAEFAYPNISGRQYPVHRRWLSALPAEGRVWTPTLYMGLLPIVFGLAAWRVRSGDVRVRWISWLVLLALCASLGRFGLGWLAREMIGWGNRLFGNGAGEPITLPIGDGFGGLYWLLNLLLPAHASFRYPAKLMVVCSLGLSLLAAHHWDRLIGRDAQQTAIWLRRIGIGSVLAAVALLLAWPVWNRWLTAVPADPLFGPLDRAGAAQDLIGSLVHAAVVSGLGAWLVRAVVSGRLSVVGTTDRGRRGWAIYALLGLTAIELGIANGWIVQYAPAAHWRGASRAAEIARSAKQQLDRREVDQRLRIYRARPWLPTEWRTASSPQRLQQAVAWDRDTLFPKYNLREGIGIFHTAGTLAPADWEILRNQAEQLALTGGSDDVAAAAAWLDALHAAYLIVPSENFWPGVRDRYKLTNAPQAIPSAMVLDNPRCLPRAWIVHLWDVISPPTNNQPERLRAIAQQVLLPDGRARDFRQSALVEADDVSAVTAASAPSDSGETCEVVHYDPLRIEIAAELKSPGLVVLSEQFFPGWRLSVRSEGSGADYDVTILRTNGILRGAFLAAGRHRLSYQYQPPSFAYGMAINVAGWLALLAFGVMAIRRLGLANTGPS